jgi:hypothetical protein
MAALRSSLSHRSSHSNLESITIAELVTYISRLKVRADAGHLLIVPPSEQSRGRAPATACGTTPGFVGAQAERESLSLQLIL